MEITARDEILFERIKQDDTAALNLLFRKHYNSVCSIIYYFSSDKQIAEEQGADVFLKFWDKRHTINIELTVRSYLFAMARNAGLALVRKKKSMWLDLDAIDGHETFPSAGPDPEQTLISQESVKQITAVIGEISEQTGIVFSLSRDEGLRYREIAVLLGISEKTVEHHMGKALRFLRENLSGR